MRVTLYLLIHEAGPKATSRPNSRSLPDNARVGFIVHFHGRCLAHLLDPIDGTWTEDVPSNAGSTASTWNVACGLAISNGPGYGCDKMDEEATLARGVNPGPYQDSRSLSHQPTPPPT